MYVCCDLEVRFECHDRLIEIMVLWDNLEVLLLSEQDSVSCWRIYFNWAGQCYIDWLTGLMYEIGYSNCISRDIPCWLIVQIYYRFSKQAVGGGFVGVYIFSV